MPPADHQISAALAGCPLLEGATDQERQKLASAVDDSSKEVHLREVLRGAEVVRQGAFVPSLFIVISGQVSRRLTRYDGVDVTLDLLNPGDSFGILSVAGDRPQPATVRGNPRAVLLEVDRLDLYSTFGRNQVVSKNIDRAYRAAAVAMNFKADSLFSELSAGDIDELTAHVQPRAFNAGDVIIARGQSASELYVVWSGHVRMVAVGADGRERVTSYLSPGNYFNQHAMFSETGRSSEQVVASDHVEVLKIPAEVFRPIVARNPELLARLAAEAEEHARRGASGTSSATLRVIEDAAELGTAHASNALVLNLDLCTRCGACASACHHEYGASRLTRQGRTFVLPSGHALGKTSVLVPNSCWHCADPMCMTDCPTDALRRSPSGEVVVLQDRCIGCEKCAQRCPWQNINMTPPLSALDDVVRKLRLKGRTLTRYEVDREIYGKHDRLGYRLRCPFHPDDDDDILALHVKLQDARVDLEVSKSCKIEKTDAKGNTQLTKPVASDLLTALELEADDLVPAEKKGSFFVRFLRWLNPERHRVPAISSDLDEKTLKQVEKATFGAKAVKCDLCRGHDQAACVMSCPYGAIDRVDLNAFLLGARPR